METYISSPRGDIFFGDEENGVGRIGLEFVQDVERNHLDPFRFGLFHSRVQAIDFTLWKQILPVSFEMNNNNK